MKKSSTPEDQNTRMCHCRYKNDCPLKGECLLACVAGIRKGREMDQTTVTSREKTEFKARWRNHQMSFKHENKRNKTELSKYLWRLKEKTVEFSISWKIPPKARTFTNLTKRCNLCITEKLFIICYPQTATLQTLNKRNKLVSCCRHRRKFLKNS